MGIFGWSLPPGVSNRDIEDAVGSDQPCAMCGKFPDICVCPECPVCGEQGNPKCYAADPEHNGHGLISTPDQEAGRELLKVLLMERARADAAEAEYWADAARITEEEEYARLMEQPK